MGEITETVRLYLETSRQMDRRGRSERESLSILRRKGMR